MVSFIMSNHTNSQETKNVSKNYTNRIRLRKAVEVKESNKNIRETWELQKSLAKLSIDQSTNTETPEDVEKMFDTMLDVQANVIAYIADILKLDEKASEKLDDLGYYETMDFATRIGSELMHIKTEPVTEADTGLED